MDRRGDFRFDSGTWGGMTVVAWGGYSCLCACSLTAGGSNYTLKSFFVITWCHLPPAGWQISTGHTVRASVPFQPGHFCTFKLDYWSPEQSVGIRGIEPECFSHICPTEQSVSDWWGRRFQPPFHLHFRFLVPSFRSVTSDSTVMQMALGLVRDIDPITGVKMNSWSERWLNWT